MNECHQHDQHRDDIEQQFETGRGALDDRIHRACGMHVRIFQRAAGELASRLGPTEGGVRVLFVGLGEDVYELELPYIHLLKLRDPIWPADWTQPWPPKPTGPSNEPTNPEATPQPSRLTKDLAALIRQQRTLH